MNCSVFVTKRSYGGAGPCEGKREVRRTEYNGEAIPLCAAHRSMAYNGKLMMLTKDLTRAERKALESGAACRWSSSS